MGDGLSKSKSQAVKLVGCRHDYSIGAVQLVLKNISTSRFTKKVRELTLNLPPASGAEDGQMIFRTKLSSRRSRPPSNQRTAMPIPILATDTISPSFNRLYGAARTERAQDETFLLYQIFRTRNKMLTSIQSLSISNLGLLKAFNDVFSPADLTLSEQRENLRKIPVGDLTDSDLDTDWGILGAMPDGVKNWIES